MRIHPTALRALSISNGKTRYRLAQHMDDSPLAIEALCWELLAALTPRPRPDSKKVPSWLRQGQELLRDRCNETLRIAEIAAASGVHPIHFARTFRRFLHCSPGDYARRCRLERAMSLLTGTALPLSMIALECGFADQSHFSRAFRNAWGLPPNEFRRAARDGRSSAIES